jgi:hypothetical protein
VLLVLWPEFQGTTGASNISALLSHVNVSAAECAVGYTGSACRDCVRPGFYRLGDLCKPCPSAALTGISLFTLAFGTCCLKTVLGHDHYAPLSACCCDLLSLWAKESYMQCPSLPVTLLPRATRQW